jgi:Ca2+-binding RTX toxin-like protein
VDTVSGTTGNDTVTGLNTTLTSADSIDLGAGTGDTLNVTLAAAVNPVVTLKGVENVNLTTAVASLGGPVVATNWTGVSKIALNGIGTAQSDSVAAGTTGTAITAIQNNVTLSLGSLESAADNGAVIYAAFASNKLASTAATLTTDLNGVVGATASTGVANVVVDTAGDDAITTWAVTGSGTNRVQLEGISAAEISLKAITVTGSGSNTLSVDATNAVITSLASINAGTATGALTINASASTKDLTFVGSAGKNNITVGAGVTGNTLTGGAAADTFTLGAGVDTVTGGAGNDTVNLAVASLTKTDVIDLGEGTLDAIIYTATTALNSTGVDATALTALNAQKGVEVIGTAGALTAVDASYFNQTIVRATGALTAAVTASNVAGQTLQFTSGITTVNGDALTVTGALPNQSVTIELSGSAAVKLQGTDATSTNTGLTTGTGISTVNLVSNTTATSGASAIVNEISLAAATTATHAIDNTAAGSFVLTGATNLTISSGLTAGFTQAVSFDASAFTGKLVIAGSASADVIKGGSGADTITGLGGGDILTGGAGVDTFVYTAAGADFTGTTAALVIAAKDTITDFVSGTDKIDFGATTLATVNHTTAAVAGTAKISGGLATFHADDDTLSERVTAVFTAFATDAAGTSAVFTFGSDSYLAVVGDATAAFQDGDALIKLTGLQVATGLTASGGDIIVIA